MSPTLQEACMLHLYSLPPSAMLHFSRRWDLVAAIEFFQTLLHSRAETKIAVEGHTAADVYEAFCSYLNDDPTEAEEDELQWNCRVEPGLYSKILYMATHGWQNEKGESYL